MNPIVTITRSAAPSVVVLAALALSSLLLGNYAQVLLTRILIFAIFAMSLDLLVGYVGLPSLGHAAFFGVGGYAVGLVTLNWTNNLVVGLIATSLASVAAGLVFGLIALRARLIYFMMLTLALAQVVWGIAQQWRGVTHGDDGLAGIPRPSLGPLALVDTQSFYLLTAVVFVVSATTLLRVARSPFGLTLQGIRESGSRMSALGYNVWLHQYIAFQIAALFAGVAGALLAYANGIVTPNQISVVTSAEALLMVILGGAGTMIGPVFGAFIIVMLEFVVSQYTGRWISILGLTYILVVLRAPSGVYPLVRHTTMRIFSAVGWRHADVVQRNHVTALTAHVDSDG